jgi:CIC family chloride channel protein
MSFMSESRQSGTTLLKLSILAAVIGVLGGITAEVLDRLIGLVTNLFFYQTTSTEIVSPLASPLGVGIIIIPAIGGLIVGLMARYGSPLVRGHGIPEAMEAVLTKSSRIPPKLAILKPLSAAFSIGSGQPFGAEGPIIQTGAALGSILGQALHTTASERKVLLACGAAAGLSAIFGTPLAAIIFAIELLVFEFRARSFIPLVIASTVAAGIHIVLFGAGPVFTVGNADFGSPINLVFFLVLGVLCGLLASGLTRLLYLIEDGFHRSKINTYLWPAIGGLFVGVVGYIIPKFVYPGVDVFGPGYKVIDGILNNKFELGFLVVLLLGKGAVWLVSLGSGTSGGVLAPVFMIGAALGGIFGILMQHIFPGMDAAPVAFAMAGMAAVFGSSTRATFAAIIFAFEMTQNYHTILPVMLASVVADAIANALMPNSILTEQLQRKGVLVNHDYEADPLNMMSVATVMTKDAVTIPQTMTVGQLIEAINQHDPRLTRHQALLIVDDQQQLVGIVTRHDLLKAVREEDLDEHVLDAGNSDLIVTYPDETVRQALIRMMTHNIGRLPVVDRAQPKQLVGYLSRGDIMSGYLKQVQDEAEVNKGWIRYFGAKAKSPS